MSPIRTFLLLRIALSSPFESLSRFSYASPCFEGTCVLGAGLGRVAPHPVIAIDPRTSFRSSTSASSSSPPPPRFSSPFSWRSDAVVPFAGQPLLLFLSWPVLAAGRQRVPFLSPVLIDQNWLFRRRDDAFIESRPLGLCNELNRTAAALLSPSVASVEMARRNSDTYPPSAGRWISNDCCDDDGDASVSRGDGGGGGSGNGGLRQSLLTFSRFDGCVFCYTVSIERGQIINTHTHGKKNQKQNDNKKKAAKKDVKSFCYYP